MSAQLQAFELEASNVLGDWRAAPPLTVVALPTDLPCSAPDDARGLYLNGEVYLVAEGRRAALAPRTIAHEVVGHHGLRVLLGDAHRSFLSGLASSTDPEIVELREHVRHVYDFDFGALRTSDESDEVAAAATERLVSFETGQVEVDKPVRRRVAAMLGHFAREFLHLHAPVTHDQLLGALLAAQGRLRHGGRMWGVVGRAADWYSSLMPKQPWHQKPLQSHDQLKALLRGAKEEEDAKAFRQVLLGVFGVFLLIACIAVLGWQLVSWIFR